MSRAAAAITGTGLAKSRLCLSQRHSFFESGPIHKRRPLNPKPSTLNPKSQNAQPPESSRMPPTSPRQPYRPCSEAGCSVRKLLRVQDSGGFGHYLQVGLPELHDVTTLSVPDSAGKPTKIYTSTAARGHGGWPFWSKMSMSSMLSPYLAISIEDASDWSCTRDNGLNSGPFLGMYYIAYSLKFRVSKEARSETPYMNQNFCRFKSFQP